MHVSFVFTCVQMYSSSVLMFHSCSLQFTRVPFVFTRVLFVFTRVHQCSLVFRLVWSFRSDRNFLAQGHSYVGASIYYIIFSHVLCFSLFSDSTPPPSHVNNPMQINCGSPWVNSKDHLFYKNRFWDMTVGILLEQLTFQKQ